MNIDSAVAHFGSKQELAKAIGVSPSAVSQWGKSIPSLRQFQIQALTNGELKAMTQLASTLDESSSTPSGCACGPDGSVNPSSIRQSRALYE